MMINQTRMPASLCYRCTQLFQHHRLTVHQNFVSVTQLCSLHTPARIQHLATCKTKNWKFKQPAFYSSVTSCSDFSTGNPALADTVSLTVDPRDSRTENIGSDLYTQIDTECLGDSKQCSMSEQTNFLHSDTTDLQCNIEYCSKNICSKKYLHVDRSCTHVPDKCKFIEKVSCNEGIKACDKYRYNYNDHIRHCLMNSTTCNDHGMTSKDSTSVKFLFGKLTGTNSISQARNLLQNVNQTQKMVYCMYHTSARNDILHTLDDKKQDIPVKISPPWKIMFFGTDEIALHTLKNLYKNMTTSGSLVESLDVVTLPQKHAVYRFAQDVNLPIQEWPIKVENNKYDVGILVSFGHLIPDRIIHMFPYGILNMHPSLLPRWRGASPIIHTILNGDVITGVSIMEIRPKHFDIGPLLLQRKVTVPTRCTSNQLRDITGHLGSNMVLECLKDLPTLERFEHEQDTDGITYAHKLKHSDAFIDWYKHTAYQIDCQYRAIHELMPIRTQLDDKSIKLTDVVNPHTITDNIIQGIKGYNGNFKSSLPGTVVYHDRLDFIIIKCKDGYIGFKNITVKRKMTAKDFYNGFLQKNHQTQFTSHSNDLNKFTKQEKLPLKSKAV
ncbi:hypothetical protein ACF0H5_023979 [Mactra antiquata]